MKGSRGSIAADSCAKLCIPTGTEPIAEIGTVSVFAPLAGHVSLLARVVNPNSGFAADTFSYTFTLYDASGNVIGTVPGTSFIYADQTKYLVVPNEAVSAPVDHADLVIALPHWVPAQQLGVAPRFAFQNVVASSPSSGTVAISGTIADEDFASFSNLTVIAVLKGMNGVVMGVAATQLDGISPGQPADFSVSYPVPLASINPAATEFDAYGMR